MKINTIIFSKDRAMQLELLLTSMKKHIKPFDACDVQIIYKYSSDFYKKGYDVLITRFPEVKFIEQSADFKKDVIDLINKEGYEYIQFGVDDDAFFGDYDIEAAIKTLDDDNVFCFCPRLGKNVTWCHNLEFEHKFVIDSEDDSVIKWNWTKSYGDLGYPLTLDFGLFRVKDFKKIVKTVGFTNPNIMEGNLASTFQYFFREQMAAFKKSCMVGIPNNIVNDTHPNRHGEKYAITARVLNEKYLNGETIDLDNLDFSDIKSCHQEIPYRFLVPEAKTEENNI